MDRGLGHRGMGRWCQEELLQKREEGQRRRRRVFGRGRIGDVWCGGRGEAEGRSCCVRESQRSLEIGEGTIFGLRGDVPIVRGLLRFLCKFMVSIVVVYYNINETASPCIVMCVPRNICRWLSTSL